MKTITTILTICLAVTMGFGQKLAINSGSFNTGDITNSDFTVMTGYDKEFDAAVKFAFDKYWKVCPVKYITPDKKNRGGSFYVTGYKGKSYGKYTWSCAKFYVPNINYEICFDDFKKGKKDCGIDKDFHMMSVKIIPYIMCYAAEVKRVIDLGETKWGGQKYKRRESIAGKIKDYTVLIQKEVLETGCVTETPFKTHLNKYQFVSSEELYKKMKEGSIADNTALLVYGREGYVMFLSIIDMKTGDLLYTESDGLGTFTQGRPFSDKVIDKFLGKIEKK